MTTLPRTTISPTVAPSCGTSHPSSSTTRSSPDVMSSTPCRALIDRTFRRRQQIVLGPRLADADERRRLRQSVDMRDGPAELALDPLDRGGGRWGPGGERPERRAASAARTSAGALAMPMSTVGAAHSIVTRSRDDQLENSRRIHLPQADVRAADGGDDPGERPAVRVKHRQRPQVAISRTSSARAAACRWRSCRRCGA